VDFVLCLRRIGVFRFSPVLRPKVPEKTYRPTPSEFKPKFNAMQQLQGNVRNNIYSSTVSECVGKDAMMKNAVNKDVGGKVITRCCAERESGEVMATYLNR
jgi:hypothetical protein